MSYTVVLINGNTRHTEKSIYNCLPKTYTREVMFKSEYYELKSINGNTGYYELLFEIGDEALRE